MGGCICKVKEDNTEYFLCDKKSNILVCNKSSVYIQDIETIKKIISYINNNNNITNSLLKNYVEKIRIEDTPETKYIKSSLSCLCNGVNFAETKPPGATDEKYTYVYINNYNKIDYNIIDINLTVLLNSIKNSNNSEINKVFKDLDSILLNKTEVEKKNQLMSLYHMYYTLMSGMVDLLSKDDKIMSNSEKERLLTPLKSVIILDEIYKSSYIIKNELKMGTVVTTVSPGNFILYIVLIFLFIIIVIILLLFSSFGFIYNNIFAFIVFIILYIIATLITRK